MPSPTLIYATGVGLCPEAFGPVADRVGGEHRFWTRPGYDGRPAPTSFVDQVDDLAVLVVSVAPAWVIGLSGGATLALALGADPPDGLLGIATHEPLVGPLEPVLHARVCAGADTVAVDPTAVDSFVLGLYGPDSWSLLPVERDDWRRRHAPTIAAELPMFASFAPRSTDLTPSVPHLTTVGARSGPERHRVAALLAAAGATSVVLDGAGHLALADAPDRYADTIADFVGRHT